MLIAIKKQFDRFELYLLLIISAMALILRLWGIGFGLPYKYHIDEPPYVVAALKLASGDLHITYPYNSPNLFQFLLTLEYGGLFGVGLITGLFNSTADVAQLYRTDPSAFFLLARITNSLLGCLTIILTYLLGKRLSGKAVSLFVALILAVSFALGRDAHYATTDTLITLLVVGALLFTVAYSQSKLRRYILIVGLLGGMATGLKYLPASVLIPMTILILWRGKQQSQSVGRQLLSLGILGLGTAMGFLLAFPAILIGFDFFLTHWHQVTNQATSALGNFIVAPVPSWLFYAKIITWGMGWLVCIAAIVGVVLVTKRGFRNYWWILLLFGVLYYINISLMKTYFARYTLPLLPVVGLLAAQTIFDIYQFMRQHGVLSQHALAITGGIIFLVCVEPAAALIRHDILLGKTDTRTLAKVWIEKNIPANTKIGLQWYGPPLSARDDPETESTRTYTITILSPFTTLLNTDSLKTYRDSGVDYLIVNSWNKEFIHRNPAENEARRRLYHQLEAEATLVGTFDPTDDSINSTPEFFWEQIYGPATELWKFQRPGPTIWIYQIESAKLTEKYPY